MTRGKTYTLVDDSGDEAGYFRLVGELADRALSEVPDGRDLLRDLRRPSGRGLFRHLLAPLAAYTGGVKEHLRGLSMADRLDPVLRADRERYHLLMLEIEVANRLNREAFARSPFRIALFPHCLSDFRSSCRACPGRFGAECEGCARECLINQGGALLARLGVHPYIADTMDQKGVLKRLRAGHPGAAVLGVACVPELAEGMRLCRKLGIPAVGVPLSANACARWMDEARETRYSLKEMERLAGPPSRPRKPPG